MQHLTDCQPGISRWQRPYSARRLPICSACHLLHPQCRGSGRKPGSVRYLYIVPVPKQHADYRAVSITHIISRLMERAVVHNPPPILTFSDHFAFRLTGSTSAVIISLLHTVTDLLQSNPFVVVICLDCSKTFDTVQHSTLLSKLAALDLATPVYNWLVDFAPYRVKWRSFAYKTHHGKYHTGLGCWTSRFILLPPSTDSQHRQHIR